MILIEIALVVQLIMDAYILRTLYRYETAILTVASYIPELCTEVDADE